MSIAPSFYKNIKRSIVDGVNVDELDIRDSSLKERILKCFGAGPIKRGR